MLINGWHSIISNRVLIILIPRTKPCWNLETSIIMASSHWIKSLSLKRHIFTNILNRIAMTLNSEGRLCSTWGSSITLDRLQHTVREQAKLQLLPETPRALPLLAVPAEPRALVDPKAFPTLATAAPPPTPPSKSTSSRPKSSTKWPFKKTAKPKPPSTSSTSIRSGKASISTNP